MDAESERTIARPNPLRGLTFGNERQGLLPGMEDSWPIAVTHGGNAHLDDLVVTTCFALLEGSGRVVRVERDDRDRLRNLMSVAHTVFDVGGQHDPAANRFDHHQPGGAGERPGDVPYAAAGLWWKAHGAAFCREILNRLDGGTLISMRWADLQSFKETVGWATGELLTHISAERLAERVEDYFIRTVDAIDTRNLRGGHEHSAGKKQLMIYSHGLQRLVESTMPFTSTRAPSAAEREEGLRESLTLVAKYLLSVIVDEVKTLAHRSLFRAELRGKVAVLDDRLYSTRPLVRDWIREAVNSTKHWTPRFVLFRGYPEEDEVAEPGNPRASWRALQISNVTFPAEWWGRKDSELSALATAMDPQRRTFNLKFCGDKGFLVSAHDFESALRAAEIALRNQGRRPR